MDLALVMSIAVVVLIVLIVGGFVFGLYGLTLGRVKHGEEIVQAENDLAELRASNPEYNFESYELDDRTIKFVHNQIDATAIFDPDKKLLHLKSPDVKTLQKTADPKKMRKWRLKIIFVGFTTRIPLNHPIFLSLTRHLRATDGRHGRK